MTAALAYTSQCRGTAGTGFITAQEAGVRGAMPLATRTCGEPTEARHCPSS
jgi:hypothetical protein